MIKAEDLKGKTIGDIITAETKILGKFYEPEEFDIKKEVMKWVSTREWVGVSVEDQIKTYSVAYYDDYIICFKNDAPVALFGVYELRNCILNGERGLLIALGNGVLKQYWFDDEEYEEEVW